MLTPHTCRHQGPLARTIEAAVLVASLPLLGTALSAQSNPGDVLYDGKISDTVGGFGATLVDGATFGDSIAALGDLNGNGVPDLAVSATGEGAPTETGTVWILLMHRNIGTNDPEFPTFENSVAQNGFDDTLLPGDAFGDSLCALGDVNQDGVMDLAVGAVGVDDGGANRGAVWILFLTASGTVGSYQRISSTSGGFTGTLDDGDWFGNGLGRLGDFDGDGVPDLAVGATYDDDGGPNRGAIWLLLLNTNGTVKSHTKISSSQGSLSGLADEDHFGRRIANLGDLDGTGRLALAVSAHDRGSNEEGAFFVLFVDENGEVDEQVEIGHGLGGFPSTLQPDDQFGYAVASVGDVDLDGVPDLAASALFRDSGGTNVGALWVLFMNQDGTVAGSRLISDSQISGDLGNDDFFGEDIAATDMNGDGRIDLMIGAQGDDDGGTDRGAFWMAFLNDGTLPLSGTTTYWNADSGTDWTDDGSWTQGVPTTTMTAVIPSHGSGYPRINPDTTAECGHLWIQPGGRVELEASTSSLEIHGGATISGNITGGINREVRFVGAGVISGTAQVQVPVEFSADITVQGGPLTLSSSLTKTTTLDLEVNEGAVLTVQGTTSLPSGGTLSGTGTLDLNGAVTLAMTSTESPILRLAGNLTVNSNAYAPTTGTVVFDGAVNQSVIQTDGVPTEFPDLEVRNTAGAVLSLPSQVHVAGSMFVSGAAEVDELVVDRDLIETLEGIISGSTASCEVRVGGDLDIGGQFLVCQVRLGNPSGEYIVVNVTDPLPASLLVDFEGSGGGVILASDLTIEGGLTILSGSFDVQGQDLILHGALPMVVSDTLLVGPGGRVSLETGAVTIESGATLRLIGSPTDFARFRGVNGGGYAFLVEAGGTIAARNFSFEDMDGSGIVIERDALIGTAPDDLRNGLFDRIVFPGALLSLERASPASFRYLRFENTGGLATANVFVPPTSAPTSLVNWSGAFAGEGFDDDTGGLLTWGPNEETLMSSFTAKRLLPTSVRLRWTSQLEVDCEAFVLERGPSASGPWSAAGEVLANGPHPYTYEDYAALPDTAYHYRLSERLTHGALRVLAQAFVSARSMGRPAPSFPNPFPSFRASGVGPGREFPSLQAALDALRFGPEEGVTLVVEPGTYGSFALDAHGESPRHWRIVAARPGTVTLDLAHAPLAIRGLAAGSSLELVGLALRSGADLPALVIEDSAGVVLLDELTLRGALVLDRAGPVLLQSSKVEALLLDHGSRLEASTSSIGSAALHGGSRLETFGIELDVRAEPGSRSVEHAARPRLALTRSSANRSELCVALDTASGSLWWLLASDDPGSLDLRAASLRARDLERLGPARPTGAQGHANSTLALDESADSPTCFRALVLDPVRGTLVLSEIEHTP